MESRIKEKSNSGVHDLFIGLVTPEWYYSDCVNAKLSNKVKWSDLDSLDFIDKLKGEFKDTDITYRDDFENSFSSWYQPYHFLPRTKWGIHIRSDSIKRIAHRFYQYSKSSRLDGSVPIKSTFLFIFFHHIFHHLVENLTTILEIKICKSTIYFEYYNSIYSKLLHSHNCLEEVLANEFVLERSKSCKLDIQLLKKELSNYDKYQSKYLNSKDPDMIRKLIYQIQSGCVSSSKKEISLLRAYLDINNYGEYPIPVWIHSRPKPLF